MDRVFLEKIQRFMINLQVKIKLEVLVEGGWAGWQGERVCPGSCLPHPPDVLR